MADETTTVAKVLEQHSADVTSYDAGDLHGCEGCDWTLPIGASWDAKWPAFYAHQADMLTEAGLLRDLQRDGFGQGYSTSDPAMLASGHRIDAVKTTSTETTWFLRCLAPHTRCEPFQGRHIKAKEAV